MIPDDSTAHDASADIRLEVRDGVADLVFDRQESKVNLLTRDAMVRLGRLLDEVEERAGSGEVRALVLRSAKPDNFIAGADIDELAELDDAAEATELSRRGQEILLRLDRLDVPTLAAIHGTCVGGGLEVVLTCDYRVASDAERTRLGLPETRLGILPGLGGTVRLPRLVGLRQALDLILSGKQIGAGRALKIGLVDAVFDPGEFREEVDELARGLAEGRRPVDTGNRPGLVRFLENSAPARALIRRISRKQVMARTKGNYPAQPRALDVTVDGLSRSVERALEEEAAAFGELAVTPECKNLIAVFRLTESAKKRRPEGTARTVNHAAVVGAGLMGAGIAELFAYEEIPVIVVDIDRERVDAGLDRARQLLRKAGRKKGWSDDELADRQACLTGTTDYDGFGVVDIVIEAVVERMDVKREVFARIEERVPERATIATNTSALSISELQGTLARPGQACGLHFFNPPHRMPLVEVVRGGTTSDDTLATAFDTALRLGKTPIVVNDSPGFVVNRILAAYMTEAGHLLQEGMAVRDLDRMMVRFGMPTGPIRLLDEVGLDVAAEVTETLSAGLGPRFAPAPVVQAILETDRTGRKGGRGIYRYDDEGKPQGVDPEIAALIEETREPGPGPEPDAARERMVLSMINEAARTLDDDVVSDPADIDIAMIMGTGFPPFRGGLLRYADRLGLPTVVEKLQAYASQLDERFQPAPGLTGRDRFFA